jgi:acetolactate synthase I/II/III large subunit
VKVSDHIAAHLASRGVTHVFEMTGGMITHLLDSLHLAGEIEIVSVHHEQAAAFAAEGLARMTGVPAVAMATSGPGATNLLTGIASCWFDSVPGVFITGQVNRAELRAERPVRQIGFQETDIVSMARPITKAAWLAEDPETVPQMLADAFELALSGRPGPVLIDIPMDVQRAEIDGAIPSTSANEPYAPDHDDVVRAVDMLAAGERPLLLVGGGVRGPARELLRRFSLAIGVPVVSSLLGLDVVDWAHPLRVGMVGSYGNRWANLALGEADVVLVIGSRLDIRQTSALVDEFRAGKTIAQVDVDTGEIGARVPVELPIVADAGAFLSAALEAWADRGALDTVGWVRRIDSLRAQNPDTAELVDQTGINPNIAVHALTAAAPAARAVVADVGQNQMWAAQSSELGPAERFLTSGGLGSMGFALPAALGAAMAPGDGPVLCITGDGGLQVNIQELESIVRHGLNVKVAVFDNHCLGMVRQFQDDYFESRRQSTEWGYGAPDFVAVARAYGMPAERVSDPNGVAAAAKAFFAEPGPAMLVIEVSGQSTVRPKVAFGKPLFDMEPPPAPVGE